MSTEPSLHSGISLVHHTCTCVVLSLLRSSSRRRASRGGAVGVSAGVTGVLFIYLFIFCGLALDLYSEFSGFSQHVSKGPITGAPVGVSAPR